MLGHRMSHWTSDVLYVLRSVGILLFMFNQTSKKMALWFLGIIGVGVVVWLGALYLNPEEQAKRDALKYFEDLQAQYESDTYGGATPEETLQLFITALEAGDIELASKYFLPDEQGKKLEFLENVKKAENLKLLASELSGSYTKKDFTGDGSSFVFYFLNSKTGTELQVSFSNMPSGVWKITDL